MLPLKLSILFSVICLLSFVRLTSLEAQEGIPSVIEASTVIQNPITPASSLIAEAQAFCDQSEGPIDDDLIESIFSILCDCNTATDFKEKSMDLTKGRLEVSETGTKQKILEGVISIARGTENYYPLPVRAKAIEILSEAYASIESTPLKTCVRTAMSDVAIDPQNDIRLRNFALEAVSKLTRSKQSGSADSSPTVPSPTVPSPADSSPTVPSPTVPSPTVPSPADSVPADSSLGQLDLSLR